MLGRRPLRHRGFRRVEPEVARVRLPELLAAAVAVQIAICADIDHHVVSVQAAAESRENLVAPRAVEPSATSITSARTRGAPAARHLVQLAERPVRHRIEQRGGDIGRDVRRAQQIDAAGLDPALAGRFCCAHNARASRDCAACWIRIGVARQRGRQRLFGACAIPNAIRRRGARLRQFPRPARASRRTRKPSAAGSASPACGCWSPAPRWWARPRTAGSAPRRTRAPRCCAGRRRASCPPGGAGARSGSRARAGSPRCTRPAALSPAAR